MRDLTFLFFKFICIQTLAFDSWKNPHGLPSLASSYVPPEGSSLLALFEEVRESETADFLAEKLSKIDAQCAEWGVKVIGRIADNAANVQLACQMGKVCSIN